METLFTIGEQNLDQIKNRPETICIEGISHLLIQVSDLAAAENFYCYLLGLKVKERSTFGGRPLLVTYQGVGLTLFPSSSPTPASGENRNLEHFALWVRGIDELVQVFLSNGFEIEGPELSEYGTRFIVRDPDGNRVECIERIETK